jgi:hypothetical protein
MYRDMWTLGLPMFVAGAIVVALGVSLDWSNAALGWAICGAVVVVSVVWGLAHPPRRTR